MLHVTNGDSVTQTMVDSGVPGLVIPWRDVLHEGPVPPDLSDEQLRVVRARFLAGCGWGDERVIQATLTMRYLVLDDLALYDEVVLWFEHDLYDQLQLIQILDRLASRVAKAPPIRLICVDRFPGQERFIGLGQLTPEELASLFPTRRPVTKAMLQQGAAAWRAFRAPDPSGLAELAGAGSTELPFLAPALRRLLAEYPSTRDGLSRTERSALERLGESRATFHELFQCVQDREAAPFLGDSTFYQILDRMRHAGRPLVARHGATPSAEVGAGASFGQFAFEITPDGRDVLAGAADAVTLNGIDRWVGGVHLAGREAVFRWDEGDQTVARRGTGRN